MKIRICDICGERITEGFLLNWKNSKPKAEIRLKDADGKYRRLEVCVRCVSKIRDYCIR